MKIELSEPEFSLLMLALGIATGASFRNNESLAKAIARLTDKINGGNPNWRDEESGDA
jgi:hypothetical protein